LSFVQIIFVPVFLKLIYFVFFLGENRIDKNDGIAFKFVDTVACRVVVMQRSRDRRRPQGPFLGNSSVNNIPLLGSRFSIIQQLDCNNGRAVFSTCSVPKCYKQGTRLEISQLSDLNSILYGCL
jgi:hypothetical protein